MNRHCLFKRALTAAALLYTVSSWAGKAVELGKEVVPFNAEWEWLMVFQPGSNIQVDPASMDADFLTTWTTPAYNGPSYRPGTGPLSYGGVDGLMSPAVPPGTIMDSPAAGSRATVYFRTTFDLAGELTNINFEFLIDDGFIVYVDGVRWLSMNTMAGATSAFSGMATVAGDENLMVRTGMTLEGAPLPSLSAGRHTVHVSLHNNSVASSDLGFMLRITGDLDPTRAPVLTMQPSVPSTDGSPRLLLRATELDPTATAVIQMSTDMSTWLPFFESPPASERTQFTLDLPATARRRFFRLTQ